MFCQSKMLATKVWTGNSFYSELKQKKWHIKAYSLCCVTVRGEKKSVQTYSDHKDSLAYVPNAIIYEARCINELILVHWLRGVWTQGLHCRLDLFCEPWHNCGTETKLKKMVKGKNILKKFHTHTKNCKNITERTVYHIKLLQLLCKPIVDLPPKQVCKSTCTEVNNQDNSPWLKVLYLRLWYFLCYKKLRYIFKLSTI